MHAVRFSRLCFCFNPGGRGDAANQTFSLPHISSLFILSATPAMAAGIYTVTYGYTVDDTASKLSFTLQPLLASAMTDVDQGYRPCPGMLCGVTGPDGQQRLYLSEINGEKSKVYRLLSLPEQSAAVNGKDGYYYKTKDVARTKRLWDGRKQNEGQEWVGDV